MVHVSLTVVILAAAATAYKFQIHDSANIKTKMYVPQRILAHSCVRVWNNTLQAS